MTLPEGSALRLFGTAVALLFLPGYALTLATFPGSRTRRDEAASPLDSRYFESTMSALDPFERIALAVGFSVCLMPVYGYVVGLGGAGIGYEARTTAVLVSVATVLFTVLAGVRYVMSPAEIDAPAPFVRLAGIVTDEISASTSGKRALNVAVIAVLLLATANLAVAVTSPVESPEYTNAALLTENDEGELVAGGYPDQLGAGETADLIFRVENRESRAVDYEVVVQLQRVSADGTVTEVSVRDRFQQTVESGSAWEQSHRVASDMSGDRVRLAYLIYRGDAPAEPTLDNSYRNLTLWVGSERPAADDDATAESVSGQPPSAATGAL